MKYDKKSESEIREITPIKGDKKLDKLLADRKEREKKFPNQWEKVKYRHGKNLQLISYYQKKASL